MQCPACGNELTVMNVGAVVVDACRPGCGGVWFDNRELRAVDEPGEPAGSLLDITPAGNRAVDLERRRSCPKCPDTVMMQHYSSILHEVMVDECPGCGGIWLDAGELARIRAEFHTDADRRKSAAAVLAPEFTLEHEQTLAHYATVTAVCQSLRRRFRRGWV